MTVSHSIRKAVIPAAGLGTRFLPATKTIPKEMLPIVDRPTLWYIVREAVESGIEHVVIVAGRGKGAVEDFFDVSYELEKTLEETGKTEVLNDLRSIRQMANIISIRQKQALGLGHAVGTAKPAIGNEPFAVLLGDEVMRWKPGSRPPTGQLIDLSLESKLSTVALMRVSEADVQKYGIVEGPEHPMYSSGQPGLPDRAVISIENVIEKPKPADTTSRFALPGRYVFDAAIFDCIERTRPGRNGEIQLTDAMTDLAKIKGMLGATVVGERFDAGDKVGYLEANIAFALDRPELKAGVLSLLKKWSE